MKNNFNLFIGEDKEGLNFYIRQCLDKIEYDNNNKIVYDMDIDSFSDVFEEISTVSMFSSNKVIIVNNFNIDKINDNEFDSFTRYINNYNKDIYLLFICDKIDQRKKSFKLFKDNFNIINTELDNSKDLSSYIKKLIESKEYKIDNFTFDYLVNRLGNDIVNINNELDKLFIYKNNNKEILREDIDLLVKKNIDSVIYEFTNAIIEQDYNKIKIMYDKFMLDNIGIDYLISSIEGAVRTNLIIKILNNQGSSNIDIAKVIEKKEFFVKKSLERLYRYNVSDLENYLVNLAKLDFDIKMGRKTNINFEIFLLSAK